MNAQQALSRSVILLLGLVVLLNYVDRGSLATAAPLLQDELALSNTQIGLLLSAFFWTYAPAQLIAGWLVHRYDIRIVLAAGVALWAVATAMTGLAGGVASILLWRLILGLGESVTFPSWQLILARHSLEHERGRANGFIGAGQGVGPMLGTLFGGLAMAYFGWRALFIALGIITLLWIWPWLIITRRGSLHAPPAQGLPPVSYLEILRRREFWGAALGHFSINYAFYFLITWLPTFLVKAGGFAIEEMAVIGGAIYGIYGVATAIAGTVSDHWIRRGGSVNRVRKVFALTGAFGAALTIACSANVEPRAAVWLLAAAGVFFGLTTPTMFAMGATLAGSRAAGRWAGAQNLAGQLAGIIAPIVTGIIIDRTGAFSWAFVVSAMFALMAMVAWGIVIRHVAAVRWRDEAAVPATAVA
jgi:MFS family permease